jgi:hypothetical protein
LLDIKFIKTREYCSYSGKYCKNKKKNSLICR